MSRRHVYEVSVAWTGDRGTGTSGYRDYERTHEISVPGKPPIPGSSDPAFRGDAARYNPEDLFVASLSTCHMLWYLHLCADAGVAVRSYEDAARGEMVEDRDGGRFTRVVLRPRVRLSPGSDPEAARRLHDEAHRHCFIANSVSIPVEHEAEILVEDAAAAP